MSAKPVAIVVMIALCVVIYSPAAGAGLPAPAAQIAVSCNPDVLIAAITTANATPNLDTIELTAGCTYTLTKGPYIDEGPNGLPVINTPMIINGHDATIERSAAAGTPFFRILEVVTPGDLTLNHLTLQNGNVADPDLMYNSYAGGILNFAGILTLDNCVIANNTAYYSGGGITSFGNSDDNAVLTVTNSTFHNNLTYGEGGGIFSNGTLSINATTSFANEAQERGGGLSNYDTAVVSNSTFSDNTGDDEAGAIYNFGSLILTNVTLANNASTNGIGGIYTDGETILQNTIIADNTPGGNCEQEGLGVFTDGGGNLTWGEGDSPTCPVTVANPWLGGLAYNGGPTQTLGLLPGSAAIDAGVDAICAAAPVSGRDQRGIIRPYGAHCDSGAYEAGALPGLRFFLPSVRR